MVNVTVTVIIIKYVKILKSHDLSTSGHENVMLLVSKNKN